MTPKQKQWQLFFLGYYGDDLTDIDGIFGPKSEAATLAFQKDSFHDPIAHDGIFGDSTAGKSREIIDRIQDILKAWVPDLVDDGLAGPKTMAALKIYQEAKGLPQTGWVDETTWWDLLMEEVPEADQPVPESGTGAEDKNVSGSTGTFWDEIQYFTRQELRCKCNNRYCNGFPAESQELLVRLAERARRHFGAPAHNISTLRCPTWNRVQGGVANSQHIYGEAMDIRIDGVTADELLAFFKKQPEVRYCYAINSTNVHFDIPKGKR